MRSSYENLVAAAARRAPRVALASGLARPAFVPGTGPPAVPRRRYVVGPLELDLDGFRALVDGKEIPLTVMEMQVLIHLVEQRGRVRSRADLLREVWQYSPSVSRTRTPDTHISRLRTKLGTASDLIQTVRGMGYRLSAAYPIVIEE